MKELIELHSEPVVLDTSRQSFELKQIRNRRFMYSGKYKTLILGDAEAGRTISGSHAQEFHQTDAPGQFDEYIRGWIGRNTTCYKKGIVHFAPQLFPGNMDEGLSFLLYLTETTGVNGTTKIRGVQNLPECDLIEIIPSRFVEKKK